MEIFAPLLALAEHVSIQHVLALNLFGWCFKGIFHHRGWDNWTDIIPVILGLLGIGLAFIDPITYEGSFIVYGMANAGMAWLLHRAVKGGHGVVKKFTNGKKT